MGSGDRSTLGTTSDIRPKQSNSRNRRSCTELLYAFHSFVFCDHTKCKKSTPARSQPQHLTITVPACVLLLLLSLLLSLLVSNSASANNMIGAFVKKGKSSICMLKPRECRHSLLRRHIFLILCKQLHNHTCLD